VRRRRAAWQRQLRGVDPRRWVFLDESGAQTDLTRLRGRSPKGRRLYEAVPAGHGTTTTMLSAIRLGGLPAAMVTDGPTNGTVFQGFVDWLLVPALRRGDVVVMDNLSSHKTNGVVEAITAAGAEVRYLPPYSPDLNPIEKMWSQVKGLLRAAKARTAHALYRAIAGALKAVTPSDCQGYFRQCGYTLHPT
jgi:transposase